MTVGFKVVWQLKDAFGKNRKLSGLVASLKLVEI